LIEHLTLSASTVLTVTVADDVDVGIDNNATGSRHCRRWWFFSAAATATATATITATGTIRLLTVLRLTKEFAESFFLLCRISRTRMFSSAAQELCIAVGIF
jgi:hypothetical protein